MQIEILADVADFADGKPVGKGKKRQHPDTENTTKRVW